MDRKDGKRHTAWGFTGVTRPDGKKRQVRVFKEDWSRETAVKEMMKYDWQGTVKAAAQATMTFAEAVARYCVAKARKKSLSHDRLYLKQLGAVFGLQTPLADITSKKIAEWRDAQLGAVCARTGKLYSPAAVNRPLAALRHLMQLAHGEWEVIAKVPRIALADEPEGRIRWLEPEEEAALLAACATSRNPELVALVTVAMETGLRRGELLGLTWPQIDLTRGFIRLHGSETKSKRGRAVKMRQTVYNIVAGLPGRQGRLWKTRSVRTAFDRAVIKAGLKDFHFHDLRHHFASWFVMRGGSIQALKEILGHADLKMTLRYAHLSPTHLGDEMERTERSASPAVTHGIAHRAGAAVDLGEGAG